VRLWHWLNAVTVLVLLMSGLMIFNAHPRLYWGQYGANAQVFICSFNAERQFLSVDLYKP
jgi:Ni,Fe-hydrogenase I cytochrome b subunit